ncbi:MAG: menaquinone biosynthesis protein [Acidobacteria bacterium]|nr:menaquinone biosynthesis protein [Acidobacteriota bacterium]
MTTGRVRLGSVNYLNARPLIAGLGGADDAHFEVRCDPPAVCATLLDAGTIDLGLIPTIAYHDRPTDLVVPGVSIASEGPVASVAIFTRRPMADVTTLALDTSSRTSVALTRILCRRRFGITPTCARQSPDLTAMLRTHDAALVIGDPALFADVTAVSAALGSPVEKIDLGALWTEMTGLPFVWAFWAGRPDAASPEVVQRLQATRDAGLMQSDALADAYVSHTPAWQPLARRYLREHIQFGLTPRMLEGLALYFREAAAVGVIAEPATPRFYAAEMLQ